MRHLFFADFGLIFFVTENDEKNLDIMQKKINSSI